MYMNCVFDANLKDNKWLYILQLAMDFLQMSWIWNILSAIRG